MTKDSSYQSKIGKAQGLSFRDIKLANTMYQCNGNNINLPALDYVTHLLYR